MATRRTIAAAVATATTLAFLMVTPGSAIAAPDGQTIEYTVVAEDGVSAGAATAAIQALGGTVVARNDSGRDVPGEGGRRLRGRGRGRPATGRCGHPAGDRADSRLELRPDPVEEEAFLAGGGNGSTARHPTGVGMDPLDDLLWGLTMVRSDGRGPGRPATVG